LPAGAVGQANIFDWQTAPAGKPCCYGFLFIATVKSRFSVDKYDIELSFAA
jgi:hypothetical protein